MSLSQATVDFGGSLYNFAVDSVTAAGPGLKADMVMGIMRGGEEGQKMYNTAAQAFLAIKDMANKSILQEAFHANPGSIPGKVGGKAAGLGE